MAKEAEKGAGSKLCKERPCDHALTPALQSRWSELAEMDQSVTETKKSLLQAQASTLLFCMLPYGVLS